MVAALLEGYSLRSKARMTSVAINTVMKLLVDLGRACLDYQRETLVNLPCKRLQVDEIWSFCYAKQKNIPPRLQGMEGIGDVWTWTAIDADTMLVPCWMIGGRDAGYAHEFISDLASRLAGRVQLTSDGHKAYLEAVENAFGADVDFAQLVKLYGAERADEARYSPTRCIGVKSHVVTGEPDGRHTSTSYIERQNLTMRMGMRRFTRLTNAFSKKFANHAVAVALHFMNYNFARIHQMLRITPAMAAGAADHVCEIEEIVGLLDRKPAISAA